MVLLCKCNCNKESCRTRTCNFCTSFAAKEDISKECMSRPLLEYDTPASKSKPTIESPPSTMTTSVFEVHKKRGARRAITIQLQYAIRNMPYACTRCYGHSTNFETMCCCMPYMYHNGVCHHYVLYTRVAYWLPLPWPPKTDESQL